MLEHEDLLFGVFTLLGLWKHQTFKIITSPESFAIVSQWPTRRKTIFKPTFHNPYLTVAGTGLIMIILNLMELYHLGIKKIVEAWKNRGHDITKEYKAVNNGPSFGGHGRYQGGRYPRGYPQAVGIRVGYARSSLSGEGGNDFDGDQFIWWSDYLSNLW